MRSKLLIIHCGAPASSRAGARQETYFSEVAQYRVACPRGRGRTVCANPAWFDFSATARVGQPLCSSSFVINIGQRRIDYMDYENYDKAQNESEEDYFACSPSIINTTRNSLILRLCRDA